MTVFKHPFNRDPDQTLINEQTTKLIIGSFPSYELIPYQGNANINYYYGNICRFWHIIRRAFNLENNFENDINSIKNFLRDNKIGIIDIIYKCYRLNDNSSLDSDLSIIELEDIPALLERFPKITNIYATSCFVRDLLISKQIRPLISNHIINNNGTHEQFTLFKRNINLYRLKSPSIRAGYNDDELINNYHILLENNLQ